MSDQNQENTSQQTSLMTRLGSVPVGNRGIVLSNMDDIFRFAKAIHMSQLCPQGFSETDCFVVIANGLEVGMSPMAALQSTYIVNNRATIFGDMPLALVRTSPVYESYKQEFVGKPFDDDFTCVVTSKRKGEEPLTTEYSVADAKLAELWGKTVQKNGREFKTPWITAPRRMLMFRARGFNLRDNFGDVLKGCAIAELDDRYGEPGFGEPKQAEGRVVEPNFAQAKAQPPAGLPAGKPEIEPSGPQRISELPEKIAVAEPTKRGPGRPRKVEQEPATAGPAATPEAPATESETKPEVTPQTPSKPSEPPSSDEAVTVSKAHTEVLRRLDEEKVSRTGFLLRMLVYNNAEGATKETIKSGQYTIADLSDDEVDLALKNWHQVTAPLERLNPV